MATRQLPMYIVDAFTDKPFGGNQAAVCLVSEDSKLSEGDMQIIAKEMNFSETAFVALEKGSDFTSVNKFNLRWFTPEEEAPLCGHATLGSSWVLFEALGNKSDELEFMSKSGKLIVTRCSARKNCLSMDFPLNSPEPVDKDQYQPLLEAVIEDQTWIVDVLLAPHLRYLIVQLRDDISREQFTNISPKYDVVRETLPTGMIGVGITMKGSLENQCVNSSGQVYDFVSRFFAPTVGILEDPVTGSWHTCAGALWSKHLQKTKMIAHQCSQRGGDVWVEVKGDRAVVSGQATLVLKGTFQF